MVNTEPKELYVSGNLTPAAVLIPLLTKGGEPHILLTKRTHLVKTHKGQVSFPGGVHEPADESLLATALREAREEIGLKPQDVEIVGSLDPIKTTTTGFLIYSFVGHIPYPYPLRINQREVAEVLVVPFKFLADDRNWHQRSPAIDKQPRDGYFARYGKHLIWGATARILKMFFERHSIKYGL